MLMEDSPSADTFIGAPVFGVTEFLSSSESCSFISSIYDRLMGGSLKTFATGGVVSVEGFLSRESWIALSFISFYTLSKMTSYADGYAVTPPLALIAS